MKCLLVSGILLFFGHQALAQRSIVDIEVTLESDGESLESCFKAIERQTGLLFAFLPGQVDPFTSIHVPSGKRTVSATLDLILSGTNLSYRQMNNSIVVFEKLDAHRKNGNKGQEEPEKKNEALFSMIGRVIGPGGNAIQDVSIFVKGTRIGTTTHSDGEYSIYAKENDVLVFSHVGYKTMELTVSNPLEIDVHLEPETLQEVEINAGYWTVTDAEYTGNISRITAQDIESRSLSNPILPLQGKLPGVYVQQNTGVPGGNVSINIRGRNSLRPEGSYPLYLIDGIPFPAASVSSNYVSNEVIPEASPFTHINPGDIESIEVLKDADATSIYGSRGANGVVLITLKKGIKGNNLSIQFHQGVGNVTRTMDLLNTQQWIEMRKEAFKNDGIAMTTTNARDLLLWDTTRYTDWTKELIGGSASITDARASVSSGDERRKFLFSTCYYRESTVFSGNFAFQKGSAFFNFNHNYNSRLKFNLTATYVGTENDLPRTDLTGIVRELIPNAPVPYNQRGEMNWDTWAKNPIAMVLQTYEGRTGNALANASIEYNLTKGVELKSSFGYSGIQTEEWQKTPRSSFNPQLKETNKSIYGARSTSTWIIEPQLNYRLSLNNHELLAFLGTTFQETISKAKTLAGSGYVSDDLIENLLSAAEYLILEDNYVQYRYNAAFSRINYNYKGKYVINLTGRRDGSSRLAPARRYANFGAVGASWIFTKEPFLGNSLPWLSFGKIRASYGITGSDLIGDYRYYDNYSPTQNTYNNQAGTVPSQLENPDYSWETSRKTEVAADIGVLNNRLLLSVSYYHNRSSSQVIEKVLPVISGFPTIQANVPVIIQNAGWEFMLKTENAESDKFSWSTSVNITVPSNKLVQFPNISESAYSDKYFVGKSLSIQNKYHFTELNPGLGIYEFQDLDGDGRLSTSDYRPLKQIGQDLFGGIENNFQLGNLQLDIFVQFVKQTNDNYLSIFLNQPGSRFNNQPVTVMQRWQQAGDMSDVQRFSQQFSSKASAAYRNLVSSDYTITDASFLRLKDVTFSYSIAPANAIIYLQGHNLFTLTGYKGYDPESVASGRLPPLRTITAGVKISLK